MSNFVPTAGGPRIAGLLNLAFEQVTAAINAEVAPRHPDLRPAHLQVFRFGSIDGRRITAIAAAIGMTKQSMHELIGHLEAHGYVRREPDPTDVRARLVRLTDRGRDLERQIVAGSARVHLHWRDTLGPDRFGVVWAALQEMTGRTDPEPEPADLRRVLAS